MKLCSCLTLFIAVGPKSTVFQQALDQFYSGEADRRTLALLQGDPLKSFASVPMEDPPWIQILCLKTRASQTNFKHALTESGER
jgi:hypothetical protein